MGLNYYVLESTVCPSCGETIQPKDPTKALHIGKSDVGWCFKLHVIPELGLHTFEDWQAYLQDRNILDDYGRPIPLQQLIKAITERDTEFARCWSEAEYKALKAEKGPRGLARCTVDHQKCIGHGEGTWDLLIGHFR